MKYDYYNHTNVFKPGYNIPLGVMDEYIMNIFIHTNANDAGYGSILITSIAIEIELMSLLNIQAT